MKELPKQYEHKEREKFWQERWVSAGTYHFHDDLPREETFVIDTPPPTVSGVLHMGHIFSYTQADFVARYQRMSGKDVFYPMGFDDNGLPTERLVEKSKNVRGSAMPRADFVALCRDVVKDAEDEFRNLFKSAALSVDWRKEYQTISDDVRKLSQASFVDLLQKNQAYRDFRPTYWDWVDQTAIAQAEIENKELPGVMNEIEFTLEGGTPLVIMTTRPELLGACVAVMYHKEDERYNGEGLKKGLPGAIDLRGKKAITPLFGVKVPIIDDEAVERDKGTGLVMCCTFGDDTDKEWVRKYDLPSRPLIQKDGKIRFFYLKELFENTDIKGIGFYSWKHPREATLDQKNCLDIDKTIHIFEQIKELKPKQANAKIIELLQAESKLLKQTPMVHTVKCAERSGTPIEIIPTYQWFVRIADKKEALAAKGTQCTWHPDYMRLRLNQWIDGLKEDWCISRQRFFGVPFPIWYQTPAIEIEQGEWIEDIAIQNQMEIISPSLEELPLDPIVSIPKGYQIIKRGTDSKIVVRRIKDSHTFILQPDMDVMDTWATSSISPQINAKSLTPNKLFPADLRPQAHEIIRTWAFYTIAKAHLHADTIPWKNLMISGWCLAADKSKMSKSKGNVITPVALIEEKGSDAVRYWASTSRLGTDTAFSEDLLKIGRKLVTKLWNASNFAALNLSKLDGIPTTPIANTKAGYIHEFLDLWILSRLHQCIKKATQQFEQFEYCDARVAIEDFFWNDFCDNYLELVKARAYAEGDVNPKSQQSALYTIYHCLETLLRLFAPFVPHVTEELYSHIFDDRYAKTGSVHARGMWPRAADYPYDELAVISGIAAVDVLNVVRKAKSEAGVSIKFPATLVAVQETEATKYPWKALEPVLEDLKAAANAENIMQVQGNEDICKNASLASDTGSFYIWVKFPKVEEQKRNPDQEAHQVIDGKILHGPGNPDLSKHVVKVQVNSLSDSLERKK